VLAGTFLQEQGLPFSQILSAEFICNAFQDEEALFGQDDIFSPEIVLWAFLAQTLRDGKGSACSAAVADIAAYMMQTGQRPPCGDTGDYCRARAKLSLTALQRLVRQSGVQLERAAQPSWLCKGLHAKLVDGFTFTMPDTPENQDAYPKVQDVSSGVGVPIARACVVLSLATAGVCDIAVGPYAGKETGESALLRQILDVFEPNDIAVFDRYYASYMMLALLRTKGVQVCTRLHQHRQTDFRKAYPLGDNDYLVSWTRPPRPRWMSLEQYDQIPETLELRQIRFEAHQLGHHESFTLITTLTDPRQFSKAELADLYGCRWNVEQDIFDIKQTLNLDHLRCKTPQMVHRELWVTLLAYNLIRKVIVTSAHRHQKQPRRLSFTLTCQTILSSWMLLATDTCRTPQQMHTEILAKIARQEIPKRPGRLEPRALKRSTQQYSLMKRPRHQLRAERGKT
jgi:hypothetical protein